MPNTGFNPQSLIAPDLQTQLLQQQRAQALADMLKQQALAPQPNEMVSGHIVKQGIGSGLLRLAQAMMGSRMTDQSDQAMQGLNQEYAKRMAGMIAQNNPFQGAQGQPPIAPNQSPSVGVGTVLAPELSQNPSSMPTPPTGNPQAADYWNKGQNLAMMGMPGGEDLLKGAIDISAPPIMQKENQYLGISPDLAKSMRIAQMRKEGTMSLQPGQTNIFPDKSMFVAPDFSKGTQGGFDANGNPIMGAIPGNQVIAQLAGQQAGQVKGSELPFQTPTVVNTPQGPKLMTPAQQIIAANGQGGLPLKTPEQAKIDEAKAVQTIDFAKMKAAADPLLQVINQARKIAKDVPSGGYGLAELQAGLSSLPGLSSHKDATNAALWDQMMGQNILSTIQNLVAAGGIRMDIPIVREIQKAGGIPINLPPDAKLKMLDQLESEVRNKLSASGNVTPQLNQSDLSATKISPMVNPPANGTIRRYNPATGKIE